MPLRNDNADIYIGSAGPLFRFSIYQIYTLYMLTSCGLSTTQQSPPDNSSNIAIVYTVRITMNILSSVKNTGADNRHVCKC